jgi:hypothetical protein
VLLSRDFAGIGLHRNDVRRRAVRAHEDGENAHRLRAGVGPEMGGVHRLHESVALVKSALAAIAVIDGNLALENISKHRNTVLVQNGAATGRQRDDRGGHMRRTVCRVVQRFAQDGCASR